MKINDIEFGWLTLQINNEQFRCSYLTDVLMELDRIFIFNLNNLTEGDNLMTNGCILDGEGSDLKLVTYKHLYEDKFYLIWQVDDKKPIVMNFDYESFVREYNALKEKIFNEYEKNFLLK